MSTFSSMLGKFFSTAEATLDVVHQTALGTSTVAGSYNKVAQAIDARADEFLANSLANLEVEKIENLKRLNEMRAKLNLKPLKELPAPK